MLLNTDSGVVFCYIINCLGAEVSLSANCTNFNHASKIEKMKIINHLGRIIVCTVRLLYSNDNDYIVHRSCW